MSVRAATTRPVRSPMLRTIFGKTVRDQTRALTFWAGGTAVLAALYPALWPSFRGSAYADIINQLPETTRAVLLAGTGGDLGTGAGFLNTELFTFVAPLILLIYAVTAGAQGIAGEEDRGTLDLLLANPISRTSVVLQKAAAMLTGTVLIGLSTWAVLAIGSAAAGMDVAAARIGAATGSAVALAIAFGALALAIGAATGRRGIALGVSLAVAVLSYFVHALAPIAPALRSYRKLSPFYQYIGNDPMRNGLAWEHVGILAAEAVVLVAIAALAFRRRDLTA